MQGITARGLRAAGLLALLAAVLAPWPSQAHVVGVVAAVMAVWWLFEPVPRPLTAVLPLALWPVTGVRSIGETAAHYTHPLLVLLAAGFVLGNAMARVALHERLTRILTRVPAVRRDPRWTLAALMLVGAGLSGVVSNSATMVMMLPLADELARQGGGGATRRAGFALGLAYACSLGGMTTLVGTPPNAVLAGLSPTLGGPTIGFATWMLVGVPLVALLLPIAWWVVVKGTGVPDTAERDLAVPTAMPWRPGEQAVLIVVGAAGLAWLTRRGVGSGAWAWEGWGAWVDLPGSQGDAWVAVVAAIACFFLHGETDEAGEVRLLLGPEVFREGIAWSVLIVMGGGFALADALGATGLDAAIARELTGVASLPPVLVVPLLAFLVSLLTELTSNTASAQLLLPIVAATALEVGAPVSSWMVATALATSCAFMMPVATPPNAIAAEAAGVDGRTMARVGWRLNLIAAVLVAIVSAVWVPWVLG